MLFNGNLTTDCPLRQKISEYYRTDEETVIQHLLPKAEISMAARSKAWERARNIVLTIRAESKGTGGIDALLNEYSLSSEEGVILMCLAEALLRVPDKKTQDALIRDKLSKGKWSSHLGESDSLFVNASSWGLLLTGSMAKYADISFKHHVGIVKRTIAKLSEPVIRQAMNIAMKIMGNQFVMGETIQAACARAEEKMSQGYVYSYDMLGEAARNMDDANTYYQAYTDAIHEIGKSAQGNGPRVNPGISIKLSAIHPRFEFSQKERVINEIVPKLKALCILAKEYEIGLTVDAEESERLELSLDIIEIVFSDPELTDWNGFGIAVQAYQKRALFVIEWLRQLTTKLARKMMVRLVKGAYWDTEIKNAQKDGLAHFPVFTRKSSTDVSYHACANKLLEYRDTIYPQFATHNAYTASIILELAGDDKEGFEFQCLHGMGDALYDQIVTKENIQCRVYAPVGEHEGLLAYLVRRLLENGANSSFVNAIVDLDRPVEDLLEDPVERTQRLNQIYNAQIQLPAELYGEERANSKGLDLSDINEITTLRASLDAWFTENRLTGEELQSPFVAVRNPANQDEAVGYHQYATAKQMMTMLDKADKAFAEWSKTDIKHRCQILCDTANALEKNMPQLIALCIKEAGKTTKDSIDEVREAVDFLRYYSARAKELVKDERLQARGVVLCISPWNFPLAIFIGQVAAALVVGNTVISKPSEQTSLIAKRAIEIMKECGLPCHVVQTVVAPGTHVGNTLLPDNRISAVMFTGSTQTGSLISRILAERGGEQVPLIAETGGQNCMIVDSTALPEQVVDDVIASGFQSAGQRCSALRVLYVQEDIADKLICMIKGAMQELSIGDPAMLSTDIGPVIDQRALDTLNAHVQYMKSHGNLHYECELGPETKTGFFFSPKLYEVDNIAVLKKEVFGPCVHVIRFKADKIHKVIDDINETGYGLTMGIHTRIEQRAADLANRSKAGNIYINRNMIGAIVGVQPFGGRGLSGTGPKAGGPNYLPRLMKEVSTPKEDELLLDDPSLETSDKAIIEATRFMKKAQEVEDSWRLTSLNDRVSLVRQLLAKVAGIEHTKEFAEDLDATLATARSQLINVESKMKKATILPGPTGESNTLYLDSRGILVCFADKDVTFHYWLMSIVTALSTGNTVITVVSDVFYKEATGVEKQFLQTGAAKGILQVARLKHIQPLLAHESLAGVVIDSQSRRSAYITHKFAQRTGAILPCITAEYNDNLIQRLISEKTISVDTTASGGNTSLMTLMDED